MASTDATACLGGLSGDASLSRARRHPCRQKWSPGDLEMRLCRALDIARAAIVQFAVEGYRDEFSPVYSFGPEKLMAEAAMLLYAASASRCRQEIADRIDALAQLLLPHVRSERLILDIALNPAVAFKLAVPHILLTKLGYSDVEFDRFLATCATAQAMNGQDCPPSVTSERKWISSVWTCGGADKLHFGDVLRKSVLSFPLNLLTGSRDDAYALTHLLFYATDFGFRAQRLPRSRGVILAEASSLFARYADAEDYDLAGEILLAWPLTGADWSSTAAFGFRVLASVEEKAGLLPCGNVDLKRLNGLSGEAQARYALGTAYHTAFVMGFLCALSLRPERAPPVQVVGVVHERNRLRWLLDRVGDDQGHWQPVFARLDEREQRILVPFLLDIAIVQHCRRRDYEGVREILVFATELGIARSPICVQSMELLERVARCVSIIGGRRVVRQRAVVASG